MLRQQFLLLMPLVTIFVLLSVLVLYVHYSSAKHYRIKLLMGPALLLACAGAFPYVGLNLGYAWPEALPESFEYMTHKLIVVGQQKRWIDVLVLSRQPLKTDPRLHRVPWSQQLEDALEQAQSMKEGREGGDIVLDHGGSGPGSADRDRTYVPKRVLPRDARPKTPPAPRDGPSRESPGFPADPGFRALQQTA